MRARSSRLMLGSMKLGRKVQDDQLSCCLPFADTRPPAKWKVTK
jgi:hypothetical protein